LPLAWAAGLSIHYDAGCKIVLLSRLRLRTLRVFMTRGVFYLTMLLGWITIGYQTKYERILMKLMILMGLLGGTLIALGLATASGVITTEPSKVMALTGAVLLIIGGIVGVVEIWQTRPMRYRRTRRGN